MNENKKQNRAFNVMIFILISIIIFVIIRYEIRGSKLEKYGIIDTAVIINMRYNGRGTPYVEYEFISNNIRYTNSEIYSYKDRIYLQIGKCFLVKYMPNNPLFSRLITDKNDKYCEIFLKDSLKTP